MNKVPTISTDGQNLGEGIAEMVAHAEAIIAMATRLGHNATPGSGAQTQDSGDNSPPPPKKPPVFGG